MENLTQIQFVDVQLDKTYIVIFGYNPQLGETNLTKCTGKDILKRVVTEIEADFPHDEPDLEGWAKIFKSEFESEGIDYCLIYEL